MERDRTLILDIVAETACRCKAVHLGNAGLDESPSLAEIPFGAEEGY